MYFFLDFYRKGQKNLFTVLTEESSIPDDDDKWDKQIIACYWKRDKQTPEMVSMGNKRDKKRKRTSTQR